MNSLKTLLIIGLALYIGATTLNAQNVTILDANFKTYLVGDTAINTNGDTEIQVSEALAFSGRIDCSNLNVADMTGIEAFVHLTKLNCHRNALTSLDVSQNTSLTHLTCYRNNLSHLDVTQNTSLVYLHCTGNSISNLDVTPNIGLTRLYCSVNPISSLDLSQNTSLERLYCNSTQISSLDLSQNPSLKVLDCSSTQLSRLNVKNGNNTSIVTFKADNNLNLTCIEVDNATYSTANWMDIDSATLFSANCNYPAPVVHIPDGDFKACLLSNPMINTNGDAEIQVSEALAFTGKMDCSNMNIADMTGVEAFVNLTKLRCHRNILTALDVSQNTSLTQLSCYRNNLSRLDVRQNTNLVFLHCTGNSISRLEVAQNTGLTRLYCSVNPISRLDVSQNTNLERLYCNSTQLTSLDLTQNRDLEVLDCSSTLLSSLNVKNGNNTNITIFKAINNPNLTCIEVDNAAYSTTNWMDVDGTASFSSNCGVVSPRMANVNTVNEEMNLNAYPNPTTADVTVDFGKIYEEANIQITNLRGQVVLNKKIENSSQTILALGETTGVYFVKIKTQGGCKTLKVIKG